MDDTCRAIDVLLASQSSSATRSSSSSRSATTISVSTATPTISSRTTPLSFSQGLPSGSPIVKPPPSGGQNDATIPPSWGYVSVPRPTDTIRIPVTGTLSVTRKPGTTPTISVAVTDTRFSKLRATTGSTLALTGPISNPPTIRPRPTGVSCLPMSNASRHSNGTSYRNGTAIGTIAVPGCTASPTLSRTPAYVTGAPLNRTATPWILPGSGSLPYGTGSLNVTRTTTGAFPAQYTGGSGTQSIKESWHFIICLLILISWAVK